MHHCSHKFAPPHLSSLTGSLFWKIWWQSKSKQREQKDLMLFLHQLLLEKEFQNYTWHQAFPVRKRTEKEFPLDSRHSCPPATFHKVLDHPSFTCINLGTKTISWQVLGTESWEHTWLGSRKWPYLENHGLQSWSVGHQSDSDSFSAKIVIECHFICEMFCTDFIKDRGS